MKNSQKGSSVAIAIVVVLLLIVGGIYFYSRPETVSQSENTAATSTTPQEEVKKEVGVPATKVAVVKTESAKATPTATTPTPAVPTVDTRFDMFFKKWVIAWQKRDTTVLVNTFGYEDFQVKNMSDDPIWHYDSYVLYKTVSTSASAEDVAYYKDNGGEIPYDIKVKGYYIVSKGTGPYHIAIIHGNYKKNTETAGITQWQIYPTPDDPKTYATIQEAQAMIDKLAKF